MSTAKLAPGRRRNNSIDSYQPIQLPSPEIGERELRSQVEHKFLEMNEVHDRIRGEFLQSHNDKRGQNRRPILEV
jgi:hypothetical protein